MKKARLRRNDQLGFAVTARFDDLPGRSFRSC
jgi:hypothetical protein